MRSLRWTFRLLLALAACWFGGFLWFTAHLPVPRGAGDVTARADGVVVLTGGANRIASGIELLRRGRGGKLLISGVHRDSLRGDLPSSLRGRLSDRLIKCCVELDRMAADTIGNARQTALWSQRNNLKTVHLVTASYHLPRSMLWMKHHSADVNFLPYAVFSQAVMLDEWWRRPGTARLLALEYSKYLASLLRLRYWAAP